MDTRDGEIVPLDGLEVSSYLQSGGPLAAVHADFEERRSQIDLLIHVVDAFNDESIGVFEAGTGVGKSYAYLIPAILWHLKNRERVVISTGTVNLQHQIVDKDLPVAVSLVSAGGGIKKAQPEAVAGRDADKEGETGDEGRNSGGEGETGSEIKYLLVKGRGRYLCLRRFEEVLSDKDLFDKDGEVDAIAGWINTTVDGSREDLPFMVDGGLWIQINSESDSCLGSRCEHRETCFVMRLKKKAAEAGILVVNHHLLFADIASRADGAGYTDSAVLPPYQRLIFDEAHGIEEAATSFFSHSLHRFAVIRELGVLHRHRRGTPSGLLGVLQNFSTATEEAASIPALTLRVNAAAAGLDDEGINLLDRVNSGSYRLSEKTVGLFTGLFTGFHRLHSELAVYLEALRCLLEGIDEKDEGQVVVWEGRQVLRRLTDAASFCASFIDWEDQGTRVFWIERRVLPKRDTREAAPFVVFTSTPLDIGEKMAEDVFDRFPTVVSVSATLRTGASFAPFLHRVGLRGSKNRVITGTFPSPFPYARRVLLAVPTDSPSPADTAGFQVFVNDAVVSLIQAAGGRTLVLFTAFNALRSAREHAALKLAGAYTLLSQGDDDRSRLLDRFKADTGSVLFGTDSFWEGVDVPGDSLSQVIIVKLPFPVPSDPVFAARCDAVENRGGNAFAELSIPDAVLRFRQGFGRLLRRCDDRGAVSVLDSRLVTKSYGRTFLDSLPSTRKITAPFAAVVKAVGDFLTE